MDNRPPPPPHGNTSSNSHTNPNAKSSGLPPGNYDIFIVPPHSAGSGFLYLPSLQPHRNSFLAGVASTLAVVGIWSVVVPIIRQWIASVAASGGIGVLALVIGVGVGGWAFGKTQIETQGGSHGGADPGAGAGASAGTAGPRPTPFGAGTTPKPTGQANGTGQSSASEGWAKAREETRKREEEKRTKEEAERKAREASEKDKWEKARARERENREKEAREKIIQERMRKEQEAKADADAKARASASASPSKVSSGARAAAREAAGVNASPNSKSYRKPVAQSYADEDEYSYRPYDTPKQPKAQNSNSSFKSTSSYASQSTARTTPPPSNRGPYSTKDPDKIQIKAVYAFSDLFPKPVAQLVAGVGNITDGLVLKMTTEGLFIDDDLRGVGQREWDVKAWSLKLIEVWCPQFSAKCAPLSSTSRLGLKQKDAAQRFWTPTSGPKNLSAEELDLIIVDLLRTCRDSCVVSSSASRGHGRDQASDESQNGDLKPLHVLRASTREANNKKYVFVIEASEAWKVAVGLQTLRRGSQVRSLGVGGMSAGECTRVLGSLGWV